MKYRKKTALAFLTFIITFSYVYFVPPTPRLATSSLSKHEATIYGVLEREGSHLNFKTRCEIAKKVIELSSLYRIDPLLILAVVKVESSFNPAAVSNKGAMGLMQVMPVVVRDVGREMGTNSADHARLLQGHLFNLHIGVHYLSKLIHLYRGDMNKALMAYNRGPTSVSRSYSHRLAPTGGYQGKVLRVYRNYSNI